MKNKMLAALATCLVSMTGVVAAEQSTEATTATPATDTPAAAVPADTISAGPKAIAVDAAAQARFGVTFATLKGMAAPTDAASTARVLDPASLLQLDGVLATAAASFTASRTEVLRVRKAYSEDRTASYRDVQAANAQAAADLERVNAARRELALRWGGGVADMQAHRRAELLNDLANAHAELVRVEIPAGMPIPRAGSNLTVRGSSAAEVFSGEVLGGLPPTADPGGSQTRAVLVELKADAAKLPVGQTLSAEVPNPDVAGTDGVILPRAALVRRDARAWVYVQTAPTEFIRREVHGLRSVTSGWFVAQGFAPGDRVVATGAPSLLGIESPAPAGTDTN
jgi:hypothetical protein